MQAFFASPAANLDVQSLEPKQFFASGDAVVVLGAWTARAKPTSEPFTSEWAMAWSLRDGKVTSFQSYEDTYAIATAFGAQT